MTEALAVLRVGMCCPVGLDAAQTTSAIRAGVSRKRASPLRDANRRRIVLGHLADEHLPELAPALAEQARLGRLGRLDEVEVRMLRLAGPALAELLAPPFAEIELPLLVAGPRASAGFVERLGVQAKARVQLDHSRGLELGGAGLFAAIAAARELLGTGQEKFAIVGGVDTFYDPPRLAALEAAGRLRTSGPQDAFTPGEAAGFAIVATQATCRRHSFEPLAWIGDVALTEAGDPALRHPSEALAAVCTKLLAGPGAPREPIRLVMAGLDGESRSAREWGVAAIRMREHLAEPLQIEHPAEYVGDAGAGLAPLMLGTASLLLRARLVSGPALVWAGTDDDRRGALILYAGP